MNRPLPRSQARTNGSLAAPLAAALLGASLLGGCVSEATYEQSVADARAARAETARRDAMLAQLHTQSLAINERLQAELARQADVQRMLLTEMGRVREAASQARQEPASKPAAPRAETVALQQRIRQLEQQQQQAAARAEELQAELHRVQASRAQLARGRKGGPIVQLDVADPWY